MPVAPHPKPDPTGSYSIVLEPSATASAPTQFTAPAITEPDPTGSYSTALEPGATAPTPTDDTNPTNLGRSRRDRGLWKRAQRKQEKEVQKRERAEQKREKGSIAARKRIEERKIECFESINRNPEGISQLPVDNELHRDKRALPL